MATPTVTVNMTKEQLIARIAELEAKKSPKLYAKVSEKGACSVYGMGRFPVTLYDEQWDKLIAFLPELNEFRKANKAKFSTKEQSVARKALEAAKTPVN